MTSRRPRPRIVLVLLAALVVPVVDVGLARAAPGILVAQGAVGTLLAPPPDKLGEPVPPRPSMEGVPGAQMGQNFMNARGGGPPAAPAAGGADAGGNVSMPKYYFSYLLMLLVMGLGIYITCKPTRRTSFD